MVGVQQTNNSKKVTFKRPNRLLDYFSSYNVYINDVKYNIDNNSKLTLDLNNDINTVFVKHWYIKSNTLFIDGDKIHKIIIKNYMPNKRFFIYLAAIVVSMFLTFFLHIDSFFINFMIKFIGFYIFSIPINFMTFDAKRYLIIEEKEIK